MRPCELPLRRMDILLAKLKPCRWKSNRTGQLRYCCVAMAPVIGPPRRPGALPRGARDLRRADNFCDCRVPRMKDVPAMHIEVSHTDNHSAQRVLPIGDVFATPTQCQPHQVRILGG